MRRFLPLKYISFLMILTSLVRLVFGLGMINIFVTARSFGGEQEALTLALIAFLLILCCAVCEMICGFHGALNWEEPLRAGRTFAWGCAALALGLLGNGVQRATGYGVSIVAWSTGVIVPALFLLAAGWFWRGSRTVREDAKRL